MTANLIARYYQPLLAQRDELRAQQALYLERQHELLENAGLAAIPGVAFLSYPFGMILNYSTVLSQPITSLRSMDITLAGICAGVRGVPLQLVKGWLRPPVAVMTVVAAGFLGVSAFYGLRALHQRWLASSFDADIEANARRLNTPMEGHQTWEVKSANRGYLWGRHSFEVVTDHKVRYHSLHSKASIEELAQEGPVVVILDDPSKGVGDLQELSTRHPIYLVSLDGQEPYLNYTNGHVRNCLRNNKGEHTLTLRSGRWHITSDR